MINVVTSCSAAGWKKYGAQFVDTFVKYWPKEVTLWVVSEDPLLLATATNVRFLPLQYSDSWAHFNEFVGGRKFAAGDATAPRPDYLTARWRDNSGYNFRFDAVKFSKKVFAIELVAAQVKTGKLLWIDADVRTFAPVPIDLAEKTLPLNFAISCLARLGYHSECGYVGYDMNKRAAINFIREFAALYASGEVFKLSEWHDSWVFDYLRNKMLVPTYNIPHKSKGHPFINSVLGQYLDHMKGNRKERGRTPKSEQITHSKLDYWR